MSVELDPTAIRKALTAYRLKGTPFEVAWRNAAPAESEVNTSNGDRGVYKFMRKHFQAAYVGDDSPRGRFRPDKSETFQFVEHEHCTVVEFKRCQSGDGCERPAVRGRHGRVWCEYHGAELERIAARVNVTIEAYTIKGTRGGRAREAA